MITQWTPVLSLALLCLVRASPLLELQFSCDHAEKFLIKVNGSVWLQNGMVAVRHDNALLSTTDLSLRRGSCEIVSGYEQTTQMPWKGPRVSWQGNGMNFETTIKVFETGDRIAFQSRWPTGANGTSDEVRRCGLNSWIGCDWPGVVSMFPSFDVPEVETPLGAMEWYGEHINDAHNDQHRGPRLSRWGPSLNITGGLLGGPIALFDDGSLCIVASATRNFMSSSAAFNHSRLSFGIMGGVEQIESDFMHEIIIVGGSEGINHAFGSWGSELLKRGGKATSTTDPTLRTLGYDTDNGAYYYYRDEVFGRVASSFPNQTEVWLAQSAVGPSLVYDIIFAADLQTEVVLSAPLCSRSSHLDGVVYRVDHASPNATLSLHPINCLTPLRLSPRPLPDFAIYIVAPATQDGWILLGELDKFVPVSPTRFVNNTPSSVGVRGSAGEEVTVTWVHVNHLSRVTTSRCVFPEDCGADCTARNTPYHCQVE